MSEHRQSRRGFLKLGGASAGGLWLAAQWPLLAAAGEAAAAARETGAGMAHLAAAEAADLEAIAAQILPSDDTPGAREAGVIYFIDRALGTFMAAQAETTRDGLARLNAEVTALAAGATRFAMLDSAQQRTLLERHEHTAFFGTVRFLTLAGMFAMPGWGGNRDQLGWELLGFDHRHVWRPPFGHYDAALAGADRSAEDT